MDPFVAEIRIFGFNFAPTGWAMCNGQLLPVSQNTGLWSLLGTFYGGDGKSTFALPNLQGCAPLHQGQGPGLSDRFLGETAGTHTISLLVSEIPVHTHQVRGHTADPGDNQLPSPVVVLAKSDNGQAYQTNTSGVVAMAPAALPAAGGGLPHNNRQPYLALNFCIALQGVFPPRG